MYVYMYIYIHFIYMYKYIILWNYCATMEVSSSVEELTHKSSGQTIVKINRLKP